MLVQGHLFYTISTYVGVAVVVGAVRVGIVVRVGVWDAGAEIARAKVVALRKEC